MMVVVFGNLKRVGALCSNSQSVTIHLTGNGIASRLHKPILDMFGNVNTRFVRISDFISPNDAGVFKKTSGDWLILGTPVYKQKNHIINACRFYDKVLCEKPVALSLDEIEQIEKVIDQHNTLFRVNYALRFLPIIDDVSQFIDNNEIKSVSIKCNANFNSRPANKEWKNDYKLGGGILYSIFPHFVDLLNFLKCESDLSSISFKSTTTVPMNDIEFSAETLNKCSVSININLCKDFDELVIEVVTTKGETRTFDLINSPKQIIDGTRYPNGTLSATSEISPWRISFKYLLKKLFSDPYNYKLAKIEDAKKVHEVLSVILNKSTQ